MRSFPVRHRIAAAAALATLVFARFSGAAEQSGPANGFVEDGDWQLVQANCTECHSALLITQNAGNRAVWRSRLLRMRQNHGMDELDSAVEARILDYLTAHYGPRNSARRMPLAAHLLPENPYSQP